MPLPTLDGEKSALCSGKTHCFYLPVLFIIETSLNKWSRTKEVNVSGHKMCRKAINTWRTVSYKARINFILVIFFNKCIYLFLTELGLRCCTGIFSGCGEQEILPSCEGFSLPWLLLFQSLGSRVQASVVVATGLVAPRKVWNLPAPGMEPMSPALAGGFLAAGLPGKSVSFICSREWEMETFISDYSF